MSDDSNGDIETASNTFDFDGVKNDINRRAIAIGFLLVFLSGFVDWYEFEGKLSDGDVTETFMEGDLTGEDARDSYDHAKNLWFLSIIGLGAILLNKDVLNQHIGNKNYGNLFLGAGVICLLLAYSVYSEINEDMDDIEDSLDAMASLYSAEGAEFDESYSVSADFDSKYKIGFYMALLGPLGVLYGGYNINLLNQIQRD